MKKLFLKNFLLLIFLSISICLISFFYVDNQKKVDNSAYEQQLISILFSNINEYNYNVTYDYITNNLQSSKMYILDNDKNIVVGPNNNIDIKKIESLINKSDDVNTVYSTKTNSNGYNEQYVIAKKNDYILVASTYFNNKYDRIHLIIFYFLITLASIIILTLIHKKYKSRVYANNKYISDIIKNIDDENIIYNYDNEIGEMSKVIYDKSKKIISNYSELKSNNDKWEFVFGTINQGIIVVDEKKNILTINDICINMFNVNKDIKNGKIHSILFDKNFIYILDDVIQNGGKKSFDYIYKSHLIYNITVIKSSKNLFTNDTSKSVYIIIVTDVTENRNFIKLRQEFFSDASHELKTPITSVIGFSEILVSDIALDEDKKKEYLFKILNQSKRMNDTINDILKISNYDENRQEKGFDLVNIKNVINKIIDNIMPQIDKMCVKVNVNVTKETILMSTEHCFDMLQNLIENGVKYNKENGILNIYVNTDSNFIYFIIEDTGIGIEQKYIDRCFERFFRIDKSRSNKFGSTGLGLSIVKSIVDLYDGEIKITSKLGECTRVEIIFNI